MIDMLKFLVSVFGAIIAVFAIMIIGLTVADNFISVPGKLAEIEQLRLLAAAQTGNEARQYLGRVHRSMRCTGVRVTGFLATTGE